jgi:hypothetical protein
MVSSKGNNETAQKGTTIPAASIHEENAMKTVVEKTDGADLRERNQKKNEKYDTHSSA